MPREISWSSAAASTSPAAIRDSSACRFREIGRSIGFDGTYRQPERDESLLRAVVEVALDAAAGVASDAATIRRDARRASAGLCPRRSRWRSLTSSVKFGRARRSVPGREAADRRTPTVRSRPEPACRRRPGLLIDQETDGEAAGRLSGHVCETASDRCCRSNRTAPGGAPHSQWEPRTQCMRTRVPTASRLWRCDGCRRS